jgi:hypothetical protein
LGISRTRFKTLHQLRPRNDFRHLRIINEEGFVDLAQCRGFNQIGERPPFRLGGSDKRRVGFIVQPHGKGFGHIQTPSVVLIMNMNE